MGVPHTIKNETVSLRRKDFEAMLARMEELEDIVAFDRTIATDEEGLGAGIAKSLLAGENAIRVFREHRGMTQEALATRAGITKSMVSRIESGHKVGSVETMRAVSKALDVDIDDLV